ncbi:MAG: N-acetylmuramoyl-L-alanine amidase [Verrucomicrobiota bacterium]|nr:N-acetylmuramoyl-L-alanine amidase [Verrucomicrobiota bacterium]
MSHSGPRLRTNPLGWRLPPLTLLLMMTTLLAPRPARGAEGEIAPLDAERSARAPWDQLPPVDFSIPPYARFLEGVRIVLDPGHGGDGFIPGFKQGPTGVREAEVNLRVAMFLKEFLDQAGAETTLVRTRDWDYTLAERAALGNRAHADLFISLHHNAAGNPEPNYTTIWYHGPPAASLAALDASHELIFSVGEAMRTTFLIANPLMDDRQMYNSGFGVLRDLKVPGLLAESSFFSNPAEERRLADPEYNRREAHGIFLGLARWAAKGLPYAQLQEPRSQVTGPRPEFRFMLNDGLQDRRGWGHERNYILADSIAVRLDGKPLEFAYDPADKSVRFRAPSALAPGGHQVEIEFQNAYKHHNLHPVFPFTVITEDLLADRVICIDPGHGGTRASDPTRLAVGTGIHEEETNLKVAHLLHNYLEAAGARPVLTRSVDEEIGLYERVEIAMDQGAELFLSIHHNGCFDPEIDTPQVFFHGDATANPEGVRMSRLLLAELESLLGRSAGGILSDRVIYDIGFAVLRHSYGKIPAVLGESVFFTNPIGARQLADDAFLDAEARAYLNAVIRYFQHQPSTPPSEEPGKPVLERVPFWEWVREEPPAPDSWREHLTLAQEWLYLARNLRNLTIDRTGTVLRPHDVRIVDAYFKGALYHLEQSLRRFPSSPRAASLWEDYAAACDEMLDDPRAQERARVARQRLVEHYPDSPQAARARSFSPPVSGNP